MESVPAWLITTAKNMAKNYLRDSKWETPMEEVPEQEVPYSSEGLDAQLIEVFRQKECRELHDTIFADLYEKYIDAMKHSSQQDSIDTIIDLIESVTA